MHLIQVLGLRHDLNLADDARNPQVIALGCHEVRLQPDYGSLLRRITTEVEHLALEVAPEGDVHGGLDIEVVQRIV